MTVPELEYGCGSWIIVSKDTGKAVFETFDRHIADRINTQKYTVLTAMQYLGALNKSLKLGA